MRRGGGVDRNLALRIRITAPWQTLQEEDWVNGLSTLS